MTVPIDSETGSGWPTCDMCVYSRTLPGQCQTRKQEHAASHTAETTAVLSPQKNSQ